MAQTKTRLEYLIMAGGLGLVLSLVATFYVEARRRSRTAAAQPDAAVGPDGDQTAGPVASPDPVAGESVTEQTIALRTQPSWARSAENRPAAEPRAGRPVMAAAPAAEPLDEESSHGQRSHTGQRPL